MISFVKLSTEKDTILNNIISEEGFTAFVRLIGWAIKSGNPCWAEARGAMINVKNIIGSMSDETSDDVLEILSALPFKIYGREFRDDIDSISANYDEGIFSALFGEERKFYFRERNCLSSNATIVFNALKENLSRDLPAINIINRIKEEIGFRGA
jgi:hypothetical protein